MTTTSKDENITMNRYLFMWTITFRNTNNKTMTAIVNRVKTIGKVMELLHIALIIDEIPETYAAIKEKWRSFNKMSPKVPVLGQ